MFIVSDEKPNEKNLQVKVELTFNADWALSLVDRKKLKVTMNPRIIQLIIVHA